MKKISLFTFFTIVSILGSASAQFECEAYLNQMTELTVTANQENQRIESEHLYDGPTASYRGHSGQALLDSKIIYISIFLPDGELRKATDIEQGDVASLPVGTKATFSLQRFLEVRGSENEVCECRHEIDRSRHMTTTKWLCEAS